MIAYEGFDYAAGALDSGNGVVDEEDAAILAANWLAVDAVWSMGDFNNDEKVDDLDATIMAANWQHGAPVAVPEPSTLVLLCAGAFMLSQVRRINLA